MGQKIVCLLDDVTNIIAEGTVRLLKHFMVDNHETTTTTDDI